MNIQIDGSPACLKGRPVGVHLGSKFSTCREAEGSTPQTPSRDSPKMAPRRDGQASQEDSIPYPPSPNEA